MLKLAGEVGDGAVLNWLSAQDVRRVVPYVHEGGPGKRIVARLFVCRSDDPATVRAAAKRLITGYLTVPGYAAFHRWLGRGEWLGDMWAAWERGDRRGALAAVDDAVVDELIVHGTAEECANHIRRYVEAGVQLPVLKFLPLDPTRDLRADAVEVAEAYVPPPAKSWS
jgi:alkanesulfonate monooxygenase SsuD/methylene tetrahydromethanopterin reductase-like flavin-dependent oxidoreductase (luciferase family)